MVCLTGAQAPAADTWLSEAEIRRELIGHTNKGFYRGGERWVDAYAGDGSIAYRDERVSWSGQWSFHGNAFCTFYNDGANGGCYLVRQQSKNCFEFVAVPDDWRGPGLAPGSSPDWFAKGWRSEEPTTCEGPAVS